MQNEDTMTLDEIRAKQKAEQEAEGTRRIRYKKAREITCYVVGSGAFGVFFRWMQDQMAFDESGLSEKSIFNYLVPLMILAAAMLFNRFIEQLRDDKLYISQDYCTALVSRCGKKLPDGLYNVLRWFCGLVMVVGGLLLIASCETDTNATLMYIIAGLAIASGITYPLLLSAANNRYGRLRHRNLVCAATVFPILMFAVWLVLCYVENALNSVIWSYLIQIAAVAVAMLAFFRAAGFAFGAAKTWNSLFGIMMGVMMCVMSMADDRYMGMHIIMFGAACQLLLYEWLLLINLQEKQLKADAQSGEHAPSDDPSRDRGGFERTRVRVK